jgi:hypothetical protein
MMPGVPGRNSQSGRKTKSEREKVREVRIPSKHEEKNAKVATQMNLMMWSPNPSMQLRALTFRKSVRVKIAEEKLVDVKDR